MANNFNWIDATTLNGTLWDNGILSSVASINQIGSLSIILGSHKYLYTSLINSGTISQNISGYTLYLNENANITNTGIYELQAGEISNAPNSVGVFNNFGTFRKTNASTALVSVPFYNTGTVNVELGTLLLLGGGSSNGGIFNISSGRTLEIKSSSSLTNNTYFIDSNTQINGTTINILRNAGIKSPGIITNPGSLTIQGNAYLYASLNNTGTIVQNLVFSNPSDRLSLNQSANINNSGIYEFQAGEISNAPNSVGVFNNSGTFRKTNTSTALVSVPFYNTGTIESLLGTVSFYNSYTHNNANLILKSGNVSFINPVTINGGNIEGNGNINAAITNSGLLNHRYFSNTEFGRLIINGSYTETNNASINIQLGGNTAGINFDQIDINGTATFDGTLNISLLNGFTPIVGSTFDVLTYDALNSLSNLDFTGLDINSTLKFLPRWSSNKLTLQVVNKSSAILAIAPTNATQTEGYLGTKAFTFTVTRSQNITETTTVNWTVTGTGTNPANATDFGGILPSGTVSFAVNETSKIITVNVSGDTTSEPNETFNVTLVNPTNSAILNTAIATGMIQNDDFIGDNNNNNLVGTAGNDYIDGQGGNDTLNGGAGIDTLVGGTGNDIYVVDSNTDIIIENAASGTDTVQSSVTFSLANLANVENLTLTGSEAINATGNTGNNVLIGNNANNTLNGENGNDSLTGAGGKDILVGGLGSDRFGYKTLTHSLLSDFDIISDFNANPGNDLFIVNTARSVFNNVGSVATLDAVAIGAVLTTTNFGVNAAAQFSFGSRTFVAINNAVAGFNATTDAIIEVTGLTGSLTTANFTV